MITFEKNMKVIPSIGGYGFLKFNYFDESKKEFQVNQPGYSVGTCKAAFRRNNFNFETDELDFVHGSYEQLLNGQVCVVRDWLEFFTEIDMLAVSFQDVKTSVDRSVLYDEVENVPYKSIKVKEGKLIFLSKTSNGNSRIKLTTT